ncbi:MAG: prepilin-type N-terminal cleavage/methylation domain-containing protein [Bacilli bacterium]|nr:prepilin-type N-terminal cleavage/methylation domain-containing protein [Bacilli bacterium]
MKNLNKKGFTLVELLSVIVILSVVVLIATNAVVPMAGQARKQVLATEANTILGYAKSMYAMDGASGSKCYSYQDVLNSGMLEKNDPNYAGSFLIESNGNGGLNIKVWLSNGTNMINGGVPDILPDMVIDSSEQASTTCGVE